MSRSEKPSLHPYDRSWQNRPEQTGAQEARHGHCADAYEKKVLVSSARNLIVFSGPLPQHVGQLGLELISRWNSCPVHTRILLLVFTYCAFHVSPFQCCPVICDAKHPATLFLGVQVYDRGEGHSCIFQSNPCFSFMASMYASRHSQSVRARLRGPLGLRNCGFLSAVSCWFRMASPSLPFACPSA